MGTGNHHSSTFCSFCGKPKSKASLPNSTGSGTSHKCQPEAEVQAQQMRVFLIPQS